MIIFKKNGFTLIEILISLTLIVVLFSAFSTALVGSLKNESQMNEQFEAQRITNSIIENLKTVKYKEMLTDSDSDLSWGENSDLNFNDYQINFEGNADLNSDIIIYTRKLDDLDYNNLFLIDINWQDRSYSTQVLIVGD